MLALSKGPSPGAADGRVAPIPHWSIRIDSRSHAALPPAGASSLPYQPAQPGPGRHSPAEVEAIAASHVATTYQLTVTWLQLTDLQSRGYNLPLLKDVPRGGELASGAVAAASRRVKWSC